MNPLEENNFNIISYNEIEGVKYQSSPNMNNEINAWAEISTEQIRIKIVNNSKDPIPLNYFQDNFVLFTDEKEYSLNRSEKKAYYNLTKIDPYSNIEISFKLPSDIAQDFMKREGAMLNKDIMGDLSKNWSHNLVIKENTKFILIKLNEVVLLLKRVPEE